MTLRYLASNCLENTSLEGFYLFYSTQTRLRRWSSQRYLQFSVVPHIRSWKKNTSYRSGSRIHTICIKIMAHRTRNQNHAQQDLLDILISLRLETHDCNILSHLQYIHHRSSKPVHQDHDCQTKIFLSRIASNYPYCLAQELPYGRKT